MFTLPKKRVDLSKNYEIAPRQTCFSYFQKSRQIVESQSLIPEIFCCCFFLFCLLCQKNVDLSKICEIAPRPTQKTNSWKFYCCFVLFVYLLIKIKDWTFKKMWNCSTSNLGCLFSKISSNCRDTEKVVHDSFTKMFCVARKTNSKRKICCFLCLCQKSWIIQTKPVKLKHVTLKLIWRHTHFPCFQNQACSKLSSNYLCSFMKFFCGAILRKPISVTFICLHQK